VNDGYAPLEMTELNYSTTLSRASRFWKMTKPAHWAIALSKKMRGAYSQWRFRLHRAKAFPAAPHS
jgi:hypothetical protein